MQHALSLGIHWLLKPCPRLGRLTLAFAAVIASSGLAQSGGSAPSAGPVPVRNLVPSGGEVEALRQSTAVTLNYCRASFYRIQRFPTYRVLIEEQEKILNNLDLNGIADQEVVKLYTAVLVEISEVRVADRARGVVQEQYHTALGTVLTGDAFDFGTQLASQNYLAAIRTGARSWWDYRNVTVLRDVGAFQVDQKRMMSFTEKSAQFLDTFWKLARDRRIPDRWLVRNQDLSKLDAAMRECDLAVRLRVLKRMEDFMSCYPPYWYYVARTQQAFGHFAAAAKTYDKLLAVGSGHFRKDDMLAAGMANKAMIQEYLRQPGALETASKALTFATDVWEANLMCANVLGRNGRTAEAEDAILRNLDVGLEREQSTAALISLYTRNTSTAKLRSRLTNPAIVRNMPMPTLIRAAAVLGPTKLPEPVISYWVSSLAAHYDLNFGADDFVLVTAPLWNLQSSGMSLVIADEAYRQSTITLSSGKSEVRFARVAELGHPLYASSNAPPAVLIIKFPDAPVVHLKLDSRPEISGSAGASTGSSVSNLLASSSFSGRRQALVLTSVEIGGTEFPVAARLPAESSPINDSVDVTPSAPTEVPKPASSQPAAAAGSTSDKLAAPTPIAPKADSDLQHSPRPPEARPPIPMIPPPLLTLPRPAAANGPKLFP